VHSVQTLLAFKLKYPAAHSTQPFGHAVTPAASQQDAEPAEQLKQGPGTISPLEAYVPSGQSFAQESWLVDPLSVVNRPDAQLLQLVLPIKSANEP